MRRYRFGVVALLGLICPPAIAGGSDSPECKDLTARLMQRTDSTFNRLSPSKDNVFLDNGVAGELMLSCSSPTLTGVYVNFNGAFPPNAWFAMAARAGGAVTGAPEKAIEAGIRKCHRAALKNSTELSDLDMKGARVECQAFTRDGGGVTVSIWQP